jgi:hypothetical protein
MECPFSETIRSELTNCIYLEDSSVTLFGIKIYGTPWQPEFWGWAFNLPRGTCVIYYVKSLQYSTGLGSYNSLTFITNINRRGCTYCALVKMVSNKKNRLMYIWLRSYSVTQINMPNMFIVITNMAS